MFYLQIFFIFDNYGSRYKIDRIMDFYFISKQAIAPAVLNGGFSTLLAVSLLMFSDVYVFVAFFRIFVLVELFGLYNALVFLPVLLTLIGPLKSQKKIQESTSRHSNNELDLLDLNQQICSRSTYRIISVYIHRTFFPLKYISFYSVILAFLTDKCNVYTNSQNYN